MRQKNNSSGFTVIETTFIVLFAAMVVLLVFLLVRHILKGSTSNEVQIPSSQTVGSFSKRVGNTVPTLSNTYKMGKYVMPNAPASFTLLDKVAPVNNTPPAEADYLSSQSFSQLKKTVDNICNSHNFLYYNGLSEPESSNNSPQFNVTGINCYADNDQWIFTIMPAKDIGYYTGTTPKFTAQEQSEISSLNYIAIDSSGTPVFSGTSE